MSEITQDKPNVCASILFFSFIKRIWLCLCSFSLPSISAIRWLHPLCFALPGLKQRFTWGNLLNRSLESELKMPSRLVLWVTALHCGRAGFNYCSQLVASGATCAQDVPICLYVEDRAFCPLEEPVSSIETVLSRSKEIPFPFLV